MKIEKQETKKLKVSKETIKQLKADPTQPQADVREAIFSPCLRCGTTR